MPDVEYEKKWGKGPHVTVDAVLYDQNGLWLIQRQDDTWALPGGFAKVGMTLFQSIFEEVKEECNMFAGYVIDYVRVYDKPDRDPRSHMITHVHYLGNWNAHGARAGDDAKDVGFFSWKDAFKINPYADHNDIILDAFVWMHGDKE